MSFDLIRILRDFESDHAATVEQINHGDKILVIVKQEESGFQDASMYWERANKLSFQDDWQYMEPGSHKIFSHPSKSGALGMILKGFRSNPKLILKPLNERLDEKDKAILSNAVLCRELTETSKPDSGDVMRWPDGQLTRACHIWDDGAQYTDQLESGSFCMNRNGSLSYSGGLNTAIPFERIKPTAERMTAPCWFFHHGHARAHGGVHAVMSVRVWDVLDSPAKPEAIEIVERPEGKPTY